VFDVNGDGVPTSCRGVVGTRAGLRKRHLIGESRAYGEYSTTSPPALDSTATAGRTSSRAAGGGQTIRWRGEPRRPGQQCPSTSSPRWGRGDHAGVDIDATAPRRSCEHARAPAPASSSSRPDGRAREPARSRLHLATSPRATAGVRPTSPGTAAATSSQQGWIEAPADGRGDLDVAPGVRPAGQRSVPILVVDVDGNGLNDLVVGGGTTTGWTGGSSAWRAAGGSGPASHPTPFNSQYHDIKWCRHRRRTASASWWTGEALPAHCDNDPVRMTTFGIYYFQVDGRVFARQVVCYGPGARGHGPRDQLRDRGPDGQRPAGHRGARQGRALPCSQRGAGPVAQGSVRRATRARL